jgi:hypothetical protein
MTSSTMDGKGCTYNETKYVPDGNGGLIGVVPTQGYYTDYGKTTVIAKDNNSKPLIKTYGSAEKDPEPVDEISATLKERGTRYGDFATHAEYAECFNLVYLSSPNWETMSPDCKESLRIIANKIGRILNGDPEYDDNWVDIAGYATLVLRRIRGANV